MDEIAPKSGKYSTFPVGNRKIEYDSKLNDAELKLLQNPCFSYFGYQSSKLLGQLISETKMHFSSL